MTLFRSGISLAFFTLVSRIFGLLREQVIANLFGASSGSAGDAVNIAFKLPNLFRRIFAEGALSSVFIPIFNEKLLQNDRAAKHFTGEIFTLLLLSLVIIVALMQIFMPLLMFIIAPGFSADKEKFDLTVLLCRITMPYLIFVSITALCGGVLNSVKRFTAFAFSPVLLSVTVIVGTFALKDKLTPAISIAIALLIAGILQVLFMLYCLAKAKMTFPVVFKPDDPDVKKLLRNMGPSAVGACAGQLNLFISQSIASYIPGAVSILSYADRIYQFPLSIVGATLSTILLPELSRIYKSKDYSKADQVQNKAVQVSLFLSIPAMCGIIALAHPIIHIIYERGAFTAIDTAKTADAIAAFALGLPAFILVKALTPIFYAKQDTKTPFKITIYSLIVNTVLNIILMQFFSHVGIALGSSIAGWFNLWLIHRFAKRQGHFSLTPSLLIFLIKILFSCLVMVGIIAIIKYYHGDYFYSQSLIVKAASLGGTISTGGGAFLALSLLLGLYPKSSKV